MNGGTINGSSDAGIELDTGGSVNNQSSGSITGANYGVFGAGESTTITNAGAISGAHGAGFSAGGTINMLRAER